ncbi:NADH-ubiquinone oxidoreductase chain 4L [Linum perenne]
MIISILGIRGILLNRRNIPIMSMPIESMLLAVNLNFLVFSVSSDDMMGQSFASLVPTVAAAESAIGLAIFVITFQAQEKSKEDPNRKRIIMTENEDFHLKY